MIGTEAVHGGRETELEKAVTRKDGEACMCSS